MNIYLRACLTGIVLLVLAGASFAQKDKAAAKPKSQKQPKPKPMVVTVKEVSGTAHRLLAGKEKKWAPMKVGDKLDEMTVIRTGFRTKVVLTFADNSVVIIERATKMGIKQFRKEGKVTRTTLGLKYGSLRSTVKKAGGPNDFRIATPVATAAARGSGNHARFSGDFGFEMKCFSGEWNVNMGFKSANFTKGESTNNILAKSIEIAKTKFTPIVRDVTGGLSKREINFIVIRGDKGRGSLTKKVARRPAPLRVVKTISTPCKITPSVHVGGLDTGIGE